METVLIGAAETGCAGYDPRGNSETGFKDPSFMAASNLHVTGFTGHPKDEVTALTYMQARHYDPVAGRFLSIDPVTFMDTNDPVHFNRYAYANNDPINMLDPFGLQACDGVKGGCLEAKNFKPAKDGTDTVVAPQDVIDAGLSAAPSLQGKTEQGTALNRGADGKVSAGNASTGTENSTGQETAMKVDSTTEGVIHSHPNTSDYDTAPGYNSKTSGDHTAVEKGIPNMVTRKGTAVVVEKVNGQYRVRTVQGKMTRSERRTTQQRLNKFQKAGRD